MSNECSNPITVEVTYASSSDQALYKLSLPAASTVETAIQQSRILSRFPEIDLTQNAVGIFSRRVKLNDLVQMGDRIEIYRPLKIDPITARRLRVQSGT